jgi:hypothetical protein
MPHAAFGSRFRDGTRATRFGTRVWIASFVKWELFTQSVVARMFASECRRYAEQCLQLARELGPKHRDRLLELADRWRKAAEEIGKSEGLDGQEARFGNWQRDG